MKSLAIASMILFMGHGILASAECTKKLDCSGMSFSWSAKDGFKTVSNSNTNASELDEAACAVRTLCPIKDFDVNGRPVIDAATLVVPASVRTKDVSAARLQMIQDCTQAVQSQISNACYENKVWQGKGGSLYN